MLLVESALGAAPSQALSPGKITLDTSRIKPAFTQDQLKAMLDKKKQQEAAALAEKKRREKQQQEGAAPGGDAPDASYDNTSLYVAGAAGVALAGLAIYLVSRKG